MFGNRFGGFAASIPPVTKNIIIINLIVWVMEAIFPRFSSIVVNYFGLHYFLASGFNPVQPITYLFVHDPNSIFHVLFNMFTLWMFGSTLEAVWGSRRFFIFYFVCGIGAAFVQELVWAVSWFGDYVNEISRLNGFTNEHARELITRQLSLGDPSLLAAVNDFKNSMVTIGASGAVFGLLLGFAFVFPDRPLFLFFIPYPIKAKYMMIGYGVIEFFLGVAGADMVAHFAHLGGMLFGLLILLWWRHKGTLHGNNYYF